MSWILDNLQIVIAVAAAFAYWLNQRKKGGDPADQDGDGRPDDPRGEVTLDRDETERTRRIQEEIRRKIAERAGGGPINVPPPAPEPPPLFREDMTAPRPVASSPMPQRTFTRQATPAPAQPARNLGYEGALQRQLDLAEQMRNLEQNRQSIKRRAAVIAKTAADAAPSAAHTAILSDLRGTHNLRRAMVLREVLGPPVGLR
jgi:hypothetical protein